MIALLPIRDNAGNLVFQNLMILQQDCMYSCMFAYTTKPYQQICVIRLG